MKPRQMQNGIGHRWSTFAMESFDSQYRLLSGALGVYIDWSAL